jgi:V8-like Glu-specific endopeptidase
MIWDAPARARLRNVLAELYPSQADARVFVGDVEFPQARLSFEPQSINTWFSIIEYAKNAGKIDAVLDRARTDWPDHETLATLAAGILPPSLDGPDPSTWHGLGANRLEAIMGDQSKLVPISYLEIGLERARSVALVAFRDGSSGTGFLTTDNVLITNNHVIADNAAALDAVVKFNHQQSAAGTDRAVESCRLAPDIFFATSRENDWTAVAVADDPNSRWGAIDLYETAIAKEDRVNIIQHPGGGHKQIAFYSNVVVYVGDGRVQYLTDTLPGSSGSPVFDRDWNVVALHHSGGWHVEPGRSRQTHWRNEGISMNVVRAGIAAARS